MLVDSGSTGLRINYKTAKRLGLVGAITRYETFVVMQWHEKVRTRMGLIENVKIDVTNDIWMYSNIWVLDKNIRNEEDAVMGRNTLIRNQVVLKFSDT